MARAGGETDVWSSCRSRGSAGRPVVPLSAPFQFCVKGAHTDVERGQPRLDPGGAGPARGPVIPKQGVFFFFPFFLFGTLSKFSSARFARGLPQEIPKGRRWGFHEFELGEASQSLVLRTKLWEASPFLLPDPLAKR